MPEKRRNTKVVRGGDADPWKLLGDGKQYLLRIDTEGEILTSAGTQRVPVTGELILRLHGDQPDRRGASLARFALVAPSVKAAKGETGVVSVIGESAAGVVEAAKRGIDLRVEAALKLNYESLDAFRGVAVDKGCYYVPAFEPAAARITGRVEIGERGLVLADAVVDVAARAGEFEEITGITLRLGDQPLFPVRPGRDSIAGGQVVAPSDANDVCDVSLTVNTRRVSIQPVGFRTGPGDASPSASTAAAQLGTAAAVWGKGCIEVQILPTILIDNATLKTSSDQTAIRNSYTDPNANVIEVFFVQNSLPASGGGNAGGIGVASCKPVIAEPNNGNPVLTAHELGHVLGLFHPGGGSNSDAGTVMAPTGSAMNPGTEFVTHFMCTNIANPVLQTLAGTCCLSHDIGDHYLRDFPVDMGLQPSDPLPAGMTRYSMSNVWNRLTNTPGTYSSSTGPEHQSPIRYVGAIGTTLRTNYLFATVEQRNNLKVRGAEVRFYVKQPGSGGGAANLTFIGSVPVPDALAVGAPQTVNLPWTIPAGVVGHSCVFAVVRSAAEPHGDQNGLDWAQFEAISRADNDWAQRNLVVADYGSNTVEDGNVESSPFVVTIPPIDGYEALPVILDVDATRAKLLSRIAVEIPGSGVHRVKPGAVTRLRVERRIVPGEDLPVVVSAEVGRKLGRRPQEVRIEPKIGKQDLVGFAWAVRAGSTKQELAGILDTARGAYADLAKATDLEAAYRLQRSLGEVAASRPTLTELAEAVERLLPDLDAVAEGIGETPAARRFGVVAATKALHKAAGTTPRRAVSAFASVVRRTAMAAAELLRERGDGAPGVRVLVDRAILRHDAAKSGIDEVALRLTVASASGETVEERLPASGWYLLDTHEAGSTFPLPVAGTALDADFEDGGAFRVEVLGVDRLGRERVLAEAAAEHKGRSDDLRGGYVLDADGGSLLRLLYRLV